jgi:hypothetical protein
MGQVRALTGAVAAMQALTFVFVCLGTCLSADTPKHACCARGAGLRAAAPSAPDCCAAHPTLKAARFLVSVAHPPIAPVALALAVPPAFASALAAPPPAASPPLVLRI